MRKYFVVVTLITLLSLGAISLNIGSKWLVLSFAQAVKSTDAPTIDYEVEITRNKDSARKAKDRRLKGLGNPNSRSISELPQGVEPLPSNVHWWIGLPPLPVDQSDVIVLGKVVERTAHLTDDRTGIYSEFALQVEDVFKDKSGSVQSSELLVANRAGGNFVLPRVKFRGT